MRAKSKPSQGYLSRVQQASMRILSARVYIQFISQIADPRVNERSETDCVYKRCTILIQTNVLEQKQKEVMIARLFKKMSCAAD